jgi:ice-binding like protein/stigma-specific protein Stig1
MKKTTRSARNSAEEHSSVMAARRAHVMRPLALAALAALAAGACHSSEPEAVGKTKLPAEAVLGTAQSFAVLAGSTVTNTGATTVHGDLGVDPGLAVTGFPPGVVTGGTIHSGDSVALIAQNDTTTAYNALAGEAPTLDLTGKDLGGMTLTAGVYSFSSSAQLTGALTLDAEGDANAVFVFQIGSTLTTASDSSVLVINEAEDCNIYWQVGSSATLGTTTAFKGNILALTSITLNTGATVSGRALARNAAVTMDANDVSTLSCATPADGGVDAGGKVDSGVDTGKADSGGDVRADVIASDAHSAGDAKGDSAGSDAGSGGDARVDGGGLDSGSGADAGGGLCCGGVLCGATCTSLSEDVNNCGSCGNACGSGQFCAGGSCVPCSPICGGVCVDLESDDANCGSCGNTCSLSESCSSGSCVSCSTLCGGACVDLTSDDANCGSCGNACALSASCTGSACVPCPMLCGGACVDLDNNPLNCGSCGNSCSPGDSCVGGSCVCE